jgi:hypothetical protein
VTVDPDAEGTLMVVESQNDIGRCKAMGGFRSLEAARTMMEQFSRLTGTPMPPMPSAAPPTARAEVFEDAGTIATSSVTTQDLPVLPKSSVFRKRS